MDSFTGKIYVHAPLDRETTPTYHLKIKAFDTPTQIANQRSSFIFVNVTLTDVNDNKPVFKTSSYYAAIKETAGVGEDVVNVEATDADAGLYMFQRLFYQVSRCCLCYCYFCWWWWCFKAYF